MKSYSKKIFLLVMSIFIVNIPAVVKAQGSGKDKAQLPNQEETKSSHKSELLILLGQTQILGGDMNKFFKSQLLEEIDKISEFTIENTSPGIPFGFGYRINLMELYSKSTSANSDTAYLRSFNFLIALRAALLEIGAQRLSLLLSGGISWVELNVNQTVGKTKYDVTPMSIDPAAQVGLTYTVGGSLLGFVAEFGYSWNEFESLRQHERFYATSLDSIDLSGWYLKSGIQFKF